MLRHLAYGSQLSDSVLTTNYDKSSNVNMLRSVVKQLQDRVKLLNVCLQDMTNSKTPQLFNELNKLVDTCGLHGMVDRISKLEAENQQLREERDRMKSENEIQRKTIVSMNSNSSSCAALCRENDKLRVDIKRLVEEKEILTRELSKMRKDCSEIKQILENAKKSWNTQSQSPRAPVHYNFEYGKI